MKTPTPSRRAGGATPRNAARQVPPERIQANGQLLTLQETSAMLSELIDRAVQLAGCATPEAFQRLPKDEQNAFLAQARGEKHSGMRSDEERKLLQPRQCVPSPWNRKHFDPEKERELIESIRLHGILQDIIVRPWRPETIVGKHQVETAKARGEAMYEIVAGERRWNAAVNAGAMVPAKIRELSDTEAIELQAIENLLREDLNAIEEAEKFHQLLEIYGGEGIKRDDAITRICERMQRSRSSVYHALRLLKLPESAKRAAIEGRLPASHAGELAKLEHAPEIQAEAVRQVLRPKQDRFEDVETTETGVLSYRATKALVAERLKYLENRKLWEAERQLAEKRGDTILTEAQSAEVVGSRPADETNSHWWLQSSAARQKYVKADEKCSIAGADYRDFQKLWKKPPPGTLAILPSGHPAYLYERAAAERAVKEGGKLKRSANGRISSRPASEVKAERLLKARRQVFATAVDSIVSSQLDGIDEHAFWPLHIQLLGARLHSDAKRALYKRRGWEKDASFSDLTRALSASELRALALEIDLHETSAPSTYSPVWGQGLTTAARLHGLDLEAMLQSVQTSA